MGRPELAIVPALGKAPRSPVSPSQTAALAMVERRLDYDFSRVRVDTPANFAPTAPRVLQRQPAPPPPGLDPDDQKTVDAAQREAAKFKCNVAPILFGILRKHFPDDVRKVAGAGCEEALPGLRTEFSATDPKDPKVKRSVPMIYAGKAFIASTDAAHLKDRIADVDSQIQAIDDWRLANFLIDAKDLANPKISGQVRSMSPGQLIDYKNKSKDGEVQRYAESLLTFSTPVQPGSAVDPLTNNMLLTVNNVHITIQPDVHGAKVQGGETDASFELNPRDIPPFNTDAAGKVKDFPGYNPTGNLTIVSSYETGVSPSATSDYGRGTTKEDIANKATALRVHEGSHGEDFIEFVRTHPLPVFTGKNGDTKTVFDKATKDFLTALSDWNKQLQAVKKTTDCVGKTIDEAHKGEKGWKKVCP